MIFIKGQMNQHFDILFSFESNVFFKYQIDIQCSTVSNKLNEAKSLFFSLHFCRAVEKIVRRNLGSLKLFSGFDIATNTVAFAT